MMCKLFVIILVILPIKIYATNSDTTRIAVEEYREKVLAYSLELKESDERVKQAALAVRAIRSGMLPQISGGINFNYQLDNQDFEIGDLSFELSQYNYGAAFTLAQNIFSGFNIKRKSRVAESDVEIASSARVLTVDNIIYGADYAYWTLSAFDAYYDVAKRYLELVRNTQRLVRERYESGLISKNDLLLIDTRVSEAELNFSKVEGERNGIVIAFNILMGMQLDSITIHTYPIYIKSPTTPIFVEIEDVLVMRPEYMIAMSQINRSQEELRVIKSEYLPQLSVGVTGNYQTQTINFDNNLQLNGVVFAQLQIPIFAGGGRRSRAEIERSNIRSDEYYAMQVRDMIAQEVLSSMSDIEATIKQLFVSQNNMKSADESLALSNYSFNEGLISIIDLMQAQLSWLTAVNGSIAANYNYHLALSMYHRSIGKYDRY